jgi:penicillin-binding protein 1A
MQSFDVPDNVVAVRMNPQTGQIERDESRKSVSALFKIGSEPK